MGGARRGAPQQQQQSALLHRLGEQRATHLAAWLSARERNSSLLSVRYILMPTCTTCFKQEALGLLVCYLLFREVLLHFI